jgi:hypothetical protein
MSWPKRVESLRQYVAWECKDVPPDLVLAIIKHESAGYVGRIAGVACKKGTLKDINGHDHVLNHAMGLMQTIPATVNWYNESADGDQKATVEDMTGADARAARMQIRIGCKFLAFANAYLHRKMPEAAPAKSLADAKDDQIALVVTAFAVGHGATLKKLRAVKQAGKRPSFWQIQKLFPNWGKSAKTGKWINRPITFANVILKWYNANKKGSYNISTGVDLAKRAVENVDKNGAFLAVLIVAGAGWAMNKYFTTRRRDANT